jgi:hypothetical protein
MQEELRHGIPANHVWLQLWEHEFNTYNIDDYITMETAAWCDLTMQELGHPTAPALHEFIVLEGFLVPTWFEELIYTVRRHDRSKQQPKLALSPRPEGGYRSELLQAVGTGLGLQELDAIAEEFQELMQQREHQETQSGGEDGVDDDEGEEEEEGGEEEEE